MTYNPIIHHRRSIRLKGYDYSQAWGNGRGELHSPDNKKGRMQFAPTGENETTDEKIN